MKWKIGIIGDGRVGSALHKGLTRAGYEVKSVGKNPQGVRETATWAEIIVLAVPYGAVDATLGELGNTINGKTVVDVTNALGQDMNLAVGFTTSAAEEIQKKARGAKIVKAFNTAFSSTMETGQVKGQPIGIFACGDDVQAKGQVMQLAKDIGFDPIDAGPLKNARLVEPLAALNVYLGFGAKMGTEMGFKLIR